MDQKTSTLTTLLEQTMTATTTTRRPRTGSWLHTNATALVEVLANEYHIDARGDERVFNGFVDSLISSRALVARMLGVSLTTAQTYLTPQEVVKRVAEFAVILRDERDGILAVPTA